MFKGAAAGQIRSKLTQDFSAAPAADAVTPSSQSADWSSLASSTAARSEVLLQYPEDIATPPVPSGANAQTPQENGTSNTTATVTATGNAMIDGLLSGVKWSGAITYSDPDSTADYQAGYSYDRNGDGISALNQGFSQFNAQQVKALHSALNQSLYTQDVGAGAFAVEGFTNLDITYNGTGSGSSTIRVANSSDTNTAYAFYPDGGIYGGDAFFGNYYDSTSNSLKNPVAGNYAWHTVIHEMGHALGLKHGQELGGPGNVALPTAYDSIEFSVMTYRSYVGAPLTGYSYEQWGAPQTYMMLDIAALQTMYGADYTVNAGNTTYVWNPLNGNTVIDGSVAIAPGGNRIFATIWDGGGNDTYDLSAYSNDLTLDLNPGGYSVFSGAQQAYLGNGNYARGNIFNAMLYSGDTASMIENAIGGSGNDTITGNDADNILTGNGGNDIINGGYGNDIIYGGEGNDVLDGSYGVDTIYGGNGNDIIYGSWTTDLVFGEGGDDVFIIRQVVDIEFGDNTYGGSGTDRLDLSQITTSYGAIVDLSTGTWQYNPLYGGPWIIDSVENVDGTQLADTITGDDQANVLNGNDGDDTISGGANNDTINGGGGNDTASGGDGNDTINGGNGNDTMIGGAGNDSFDGGSGVDVAYGEAGNDTYIVDFGWTGGYGELFSGGAGSDTIDGSVLMNNYLVNLGDGEFQIESGNGLIAIASVENAMTGSGNDILTGSGEANRLYGNGGSDQLFGLDANDLLEGGEGDDLLNGGDGIDIAGYAAATSAVTVSLLLTGPQATGGAGTDTLVNIESINGSAYNDILTGNSGDNILSGGVGIDTLSGGEGNDTLNGGAGTDTMTGGNGNDVYYVDNAGDNVVESSTTGGTDDLIISAVSYSLAGRYVETLTLNGSANNAATGNSLANTLNGNTGNNTLTGLAGDDELNGFAGVDTLDGGDGNDALNGGTGADSMTGGNGDDTYYVDNAADNVVENSSTGGANDQIFSSVTYSLSGRLVETLTLTGGGNINAIGNSLSQTLNGNTGNNFIAGLEGVDFLYGFDGNDILDGGAGDDLLNGGNDIDTASYATATAAVTVSLIAGAQATGGSGSDTLVSIENLTGSGYNDTLAGNTGGNVLDGGAGSDILTGGDGNDIYYVDNIGDNVVETISGGTNDAIFSSVTYTLAGRYVEALTLTGSANINATGNGQDNILNGNSGNNILQGGAGNDVLNGGAGTDTLSGGANSDIFAFTTTPGAGNIDTITDYSIADDTIQLDDAIFAGISIGALAASAFYIGNAAHDADDRIIYNSATGALLFDADGNGAGAALQFATISTSLGMTASEFVIV